MAKYSSKSLNNFLIIGILLFVTAINLPTIVKNAYESLPQNPASDTITFLPKTPIEKIVFPEMTLSYNNQWQSHPRLAIDAETLIQRWQNLQGTPVPEKILATLKRELPPAQILWITLKQQPAFALTIYQFPDFWLMQNWQQQWLAVSVNSEYLFPPRQVSRE